MSTATTTEKKTRPRARKIILACVRWFFTVIFIVIFMALFVNAVLSLVKRDYIPSFGKYSLSTVVTGSMEPAIPAGALIVFEKPRAGQTPEVGDIIIFEYSASDTDNVPVLITHRVIRIEPYGDGFVYATKGDNNNKEDAHRVELGDIRGYYTGKHTAVLGYLLSFLSSSYGIICLTVIVVIIFLSMLGFDLIHSSERRINLKNKALYKSVALIESAAASYGLQNTESICNIISLIAADPVKERKQTDQRLAEFISAEQASFLPAPLAQSETAAAVQASDTAPQKNVLYLAVQTDKDIILSSDGVSFSARPEPAPAAPTMPPVSEQEIQRLRTLNALLAKQLRPLSTDEAATLSEHRQKTKKPKPKPQKTPQQIEREKQKRRENLAKSMEKMRAEQEYIASLPQAERELYILNKERAKNELKAIRELRRIERERKAYEKLTAEKTK